MKGRENSHGMSGRQQVQGHHPLHGLCIHHSSMPNACSELYDRCTKGETEACT